MMHPEESSICVPNRDTKDYNFNNQINFPFVFSYETSDGVSRSEQAELKNPGTEQEALSVRGTITWTAADGVVYTLNYLADENGFQPEGAHLPKV